MSQTASPTDRRSNLLTLGMLALLLYFLLPLFWLVVSATKTTSDLFSTFGLWFSGDFSLVQNIRDTFTFDGGVYGRWMLNTLFYSVVSAVGATLLAALGGYGFAKFRFRGNNALFGVVLGSIMVPATALTTE
jgi:multiple sugar transport system permease protein